MAKKSKTECRPMTTEEMLNGAEIYDVRISPDGEVAAFSRTQAHKGEKDQVTYICSVPYNGGAVKQLTQGPQDTQPRWAPDGLTLAFTRQSAKDKPAQIFLLPRDGGEPAKLTNLDMPPEALDYLPNGKYLSFLATTPDDKKTRECKEKGDDAVVFVEDEKPKRLWKVSSETGKVKTCSPEDLPIWEYDWLPDGNSAAVVYSEQTRLSIGYYHPKIGILHAKKAQIEPLDVTFSAAKHVRVSPDGKYIALIGGVEAPGWFGQVWIIAIQTWSGCLMAAVFCR